MIYELPTANNPELIRMNEQDTGIAKNRAFFKELIGYIVELDYNCSALKQEGYNYALLIGSEGYCFVDAEDARAWPIQFFDEKETVDALLEAINGSSDSVRVVLPDLRAVDASGLPYFDGVMDRLQLMGFRF